MRNIKNMLHEFPLPKKSCPLQKVRDFPRPDFLQYMVFNPFKMAVLSSSFPNLMVKKLFSPNSTGPWRAQLQKGKNPYKVTAWLESK